MSAFSTEQLPQAMVWTSERPLGAIDNSAEAIFSLKSLGGSIPRAGLLTNETTFLGSK